VHDQSLAELRWGPSASVGGHYASVGGHYASGHSNRIVADVFQNFSNILLILIVNRAG